MNEKQFEKYLKKTMDKVHRDTDKFYQKYPEYDKMGYLSFTFFKDRLTLVNSADAEKRLSFLKDGENGKWRKL